MEFEGKVWKDGRFWIAEVPSLNLMTQGRTRKEALAMVEDAALGLIECYFESEDKNLCITTTDYKKDSFGITSSNNKLLLALSLRRQREKWIDCKGNYPAFGNHISKLLCAIRER